VAHSPPAVRLSFGLSATDTVGEVAVLMTSGMCATWLSYTSNIGEASTCAAADFEVRPSPDDSADKVAAWARPQDRWLVCRCQRPRGTSAGRTVAVGAAAMAEMQADYHLAVNAELAGVANTSRPH